MKSPSEGHWEFLSAQDVSRFWGGVCTVPRRGAGRKHYHEERYYLGLYLLAIAKHQLLSYPFSIEQFEENRSPDFMFTWNSGETTGFEVTRATTQQFQSEVSPAERAYQTKHAKALASGEHPVEVLPLKGWPVDGWENEDPPKSLPPRGWAGDAPEYELCRLFRDAIEKKLKKLREGKYKAASSYELLVFEHALPPASDRGKVLRSMRSWVQGFSNDALSFRRISIIISVDTLFDVGGEGRILRYIEAPNLDDPESLRTFSERSEYAGRLSAERAVQEHREAGRPVYSMDDKGRTIKETPDGRFEVRLEEDGTEVIVKELREA
jgi:hypothetical protein